MAQQAIEFQLAVELGEGFDIRPGDLERVEIKLDRRVAGDGRQHFAHQDLVAVLLQALAISLALDFGGVLDGAFDTAVGLDQIARSFVTDTGGAGDIVDRISLEREQVDDLLRRDALHFLDLVGVVEQVALHGVEHVDVVADELRQILVARDNVDVDVAAGGLLGEGTDDVIGLIAVTGENGNVDRLEQAFDVGQLQEQVVGRFVAVGLVVFEDLVSEGRPGAFPDGRQIVGPMRVDELPHHVVEDVDGFGRQARGRAHQRRARARAAVEGAEDQPEGIDQEQTRGAGGHRPSSFGGPGKRPAGTSATAAGPLRPRPTPPRPIASR